MSGKNLFISIIKLEVNKSHTAAITGAVDK